MVKVLFSFLVWIGLGLGSVLAQGATGVLEVSISGLPANTEARVTLSGNLLERPIAITRSGRISQLRPGIYTLQAERVSAAGSEYTPQFLRQNVEVRANQTTRATVTYFPPPGTLVLNVVGLPAGVAASISLSSDLLPSAIPISRSSRISDLLPGTYTLSATAVNSAGLSYTPALPRQTVVIRSGNETAATVTYKAPPGSLRVEISGIPAGAARVSLSGNNLSQNLTSSATLENLDPGRYLVNAQPVSIAGLQYTPEVAQQTAEVQAGQQAQLQVVYKAPAGSLRLSISGLTANVKAKVQLSGNGVNVVLEQSSLVRDLAPGTYTLSAEAVEVDGVVFQVVPQRQQIEVRSQAEATATVAYSAPPGSLRLQVEGLPTGNNARLTLSGPNNYSRELNLNGSTTLSNLPAGEYTLAANDVLVAGDPFEPTPANQVLQVFPTRTLVARVSYSMSLGRLVLIPQGTPSGLAAQVTLSGPPPTASTNYSLTAERTLDLPKGSYTLSSPLLYFGGRAYGPLQATQTVEVSPRRESRVRIAYQALPSVDLTLTPKGLPAGQRVNILLQGPENTRIELTLSGPETVLDLLPGEYKLSSQPTVAATSVVEQTVQVRPGMAALELQLRGAATGGSEAATLRGHSDDVYSVAFSPDGQTLASGGRDGTIKLWDVASSREVATLRGHSSAVFSVAFSADGQTLASGSSDGTIKLWDVATRSEIATLRGHSSIVSTVAFSPDGRTLASGSWDNTIKLWDVAARREVATLRGHSSFVNSVAFSPDGQTLASGSRDGTIKLWDVATRREIATLRGHSDYIRSVAFSPDGQTLASGSIDNTIKLWDVANLREIATLRGHSSLVWSVAFSPDGKILASGSEDKTIKLWDVATRREVATLEGHSNYVRSVAFSPDGQTLASGSGDNTIKLWQLQY